MLRKVANRDGYQLRIFVNDNRKDIWIGKLNARQCREYERHTDALLDAYKSGASPDIADIQWANQLPERILAQLVALGLCPATHRRWSAEERQIGNFTQKFIDDLPCDKYKPRTIINYHQARTWLLKKIPETTDIAAITDYDMQQWQNSMSSLALATRNKHLKRIKTILNAAVKARLISISPAACLKEEKGKSSIDRSRQVMVTPEVSKKVLDSMPNSEWRLTFALMRYQGFRRCETISLEWEHIHSDKIEIHSKKTGFRCCPIFPEVKQVLAELQPAKGQVIRCHSSEESITPLLTKLVGKVCTPWPKVCQQLRSTRRTELEHQFPSYVVDEWLGHDSKTARKHYLQITDEHIKKASKFCIPAGVPVKHSKDEQRDATASKNPGKKHNSRQREGILMPPQGLEPWTR